MSKARLIITSVVLEGRSQADVARSYGVSQAWVSRLVARYRTEGDTAFEPRSRRPASRPTATPPEQRELVLGLRRDLTASGLDAMTITGHKLGGPIGVGALLLGRETKLTALQHGGGQEREALGSEIAA